VWGRIELIKAERSNLGPAKPVFDCFLRFGRPSPNAVLTLRCRHDSRPVRLIRPTFPSGANQEPICGEQIRVCFSMFETLATHDAE
jgi:hypothetical protein